MATSINVQAFFDEATFSVSYLVSDAATRQAVVIDPVLDYNHASGKSQTTTAQRILQAADSQGLRIIRVLETHAHADHISAAPYIKTHTGAPICIGEHISTVQRTFAPTFNLSDISGTGAEFDLLLKDGDTLALGDSSIQVLYTPGHTPACVSYLIEDAVFVGDTLFMPDYGTARADFPGGDAKQLYASIRRLLSLPDSTRVFVCHDYKAAGRDHFAWETTIKEQRTNNVHVHEGVSETDFVHLRTARDTTLAAPALLLPAVQVNIRAGYWPEAESNGRRYLKIPLGF